MPIDVVINNQTTIQTNATLILGDERQTSKDLTILSTFKEEISACINETILFKATLEQLILTQDPELGLTDGSSATRVFLSFIDVNCSLLGDLGWLYRTIDKKLKAPVVIPPNQPEDAGFLHQMDRQPRQLSASFSRRPEGDRTMGVETTGESNNQQGNEFVTRGEMQAILSDVVKDVVKKTAKQAAKRCSKAVLTDLLDVARRTRERHLAREQRPAPTNTTQRPRTHQSYAHLARYLPSARTVEGPNGSVELYGVHDADGNIVEMPIDEIPLDRLRFIARGLRRELRGDLARPRETPPPSPAHPSRIFNGRTFARIS